jgi:hypothetical protein
VECSQTRSIALEIVAIQPRELGAVTHPGGAKQGNLPRAAPTVILPRFLLGTPHNFRHDGSGRLWGRPIWTRLGNPKAARGALRRDLLTSHVSRYTSTSIVHPLCLSARKIRRIIEIFLLFPDGKIVERGAWRVERNGKERSPQGLMTSAGSLLLPFLRRYALRATPHAPRSTFSLLAIGAGAL